MSDEEPMDLDKVEIRVNEKGEETDKSNELIDKNLIAADPSVIQNSDYNSIITPDVWSGLTYLQHMALVGATNAGKTTFFKQLLADQKIPLFDVYITLGNIVKSDELQIGYAANNFLFDKDYRNVESYHFTMDLYNQALNFARSADLKDKSKLLFLNDAMIQSSKMCKEISDFLNQAKNYNITCVVEIHDFFGQNMKLARNACSVRIFLQQTPRNLAKSLEVPLDSPIIKAYSIKENTNKIIIEDVNNMKFYNKQYISFL
jgi:hypothetical protein